MRIAIVDDYQNIALSLADWRALDADIDVFTQPFLDESDAAKALAPYDVICTMRERMAWPAQLLRLLPNLKLLCVTGGHHRLLDLTAANKQGIVVSHTGAGASVPATVELCFALILAAARNIPREDQDIRRGGWQSGLGMTLHGRKLGLVGLGRIGGRVAMLAKAFGMDILAWSQNMTAAQASQYGATLVDKERLFREADVVSLHLVLGERSRGVVGAKELALMQRGAILINTARGPLVDEQALVAALQSGAIKAGLDVYDVEPLPQGHPLRHCGNVVLSPHQGFVTSEVYELYYRETVENIAAFLRGAPIRRLQ